MGSIHRGSEVARLEAAILDAPDGVSVVSVSGTGGVGKSYLVQHVLDGLRVERPGILLLKVDGSDPERRSDFMGLVEQLAPRRMPPPANPKRDYFGHVRDVASLHRDLVSDAGKELEQSGQPEELRRAVTALLRAGHTLNRVAPVTRDYLDADFLGIEDGLLHDGLDHAWDLARSLDALRDSTWLPGVVRDLVGVTARNRVRQDLYGLVAEELVVDLRAMTSGARWAEALKITQAKVEGAERVVLWFDDYEAIGPTLGPFLTGHLIPALRDFEVPAVVLVVGRDDVRDADPSWAQHLDRHLVESIRLAPFTREAAMEYLARAGVEPERAEVLWEGTQGFPFLLSLLVEEESSEDAGTVTFLKRFYDRTTRWMSDTQRAWFEAACYLDPVNEDTLQAFFPAERTAAIQDWFQREASIRDPAAATWRVRPLIRDKVLRYLALRSPSKHREAVERAGGQEGGAPG